MRVPALQTPPKFHEKTPRETQKERNGGGKGRKRAKFQASHPSGRQPSGPHPEKPHPAGATLRVSFSKRWQQEHPIWPKNPFGQSLPIKVGKSRFAKSDWPKSVSATKTPEHGKTFADNCSCSWGHLPALVFGARALATPARG